MQDIFLLLIEKVKSNWNLFCKEYNRSHICEMCDLYDIKS